MAKPILKWAGGKTQLLQHLSPLIPKKIDTYFEPFFGGGAVFFNLKPKKYVISDINPELINLYKVVATSPSEIISELEKYPVSKEFYYELRKLKYDSLDQIKAACRMIYLNRTCFNGLYRVNKKGEFNVPYGNYKNPTIVQKEKLIQASLLLNQDQIMTKSFEYLFNKKLNKNDFVFFDPPYIPLSKFSDFKRYNKEQFNLDQHIKLAELFSKLSNEGIPVVLTNSSTDIVRELYKGHNIIEVSAKRNINSKGDSRKAKELIIYSNV